MNRNQEPLHVDTGASSDVDASASVAAATVGFVEDPDIVFAFASTKQEPSSVAAALRARFPGAIIAGCTSTGEIEGGAAHNGSLVVAGVSGGARWASVCVDDLRRFDVAEAEAAAGALFASLDVDRETFDPGDYFCLLFIDGLSMREELVVLRLADALEGVTLLGGSAGDDLAFARTCVFDGGTAKSNAAVLVMGHCPGGFRVIKHQHFESSPTLLAVTKVDVATRRVLELDGRSARVAYAEAVGVAEADFTVEVALLHPLCFTSDGERYVRAVRAIEPDGSIAFLCAIEEGMVLEIGAREDMASSLERALADVGSADLLLIFNCILRQLEAKKTGCMPALMRTVQQHSRASIGFDTYGEQLHGLHINQTFVALALGGVR